MKIIHEFEFQKEVRVQSCLFDVCKNMAADDDALKHHILDKANCYVSIAKHVFWFMEFIPATLQPKTKREGSSTAHLQKNELRLIISCINKIPEEFVKPQYVPIEGWPIFIVYQIYGDTVQTSRRVGKAVMQKGYWY